jgi:HAD superfamily hydrolase (TIGR01509 family)
MSTAVIFDCDGVLVDSETLGIEIELRCLAEIGLTYERHDYLERYLGTGHDSYHQGLDRDHRAKFGTPLPETFFPKLNECYRTEVYENVEAFPGVHDVAAQLEQRKAVASSSSIAGLDKKLRKTGLHDFFAPHIYSAQLVQRAKPAPDLFLHAAQQLGVDPKDCIVIEDSVNGVLAGKAAGMRVVGFIGGGHLLPTQATKLLAAGALKVIDTMHHLLPTLDELR